MRDKGAMRQGRQRVTKARHIVAREMRVREKNRSANEKKKKKNRKKTYQLTAASRLAFVIRKAQRAQI